MSLLTSEQWAAATAIAQYGYGNPFLPERIELERQALGSRFVEVPSIRQRRPELSMGDVFPNSLPMAERAGQLLAIMREKLIAGEPASAAELIMYEDLALVTIYFHYMSVLGEMVTEQLLSRIAGEKVEFWPGFRQEFQRLFKPPGVLLPSEHDAAHVFACFFQVERAHHHIYQHIIGGSLIAAQLRASVWESIFTHDMRRYGRSHFRRMADIPSLILGPSGSGKELVARAIGLSRYIPFDAKSARFAANYEDAFHAVNLAALAPTLVESDLFGHKKGSFTGAIADRIGWLEACDEHATIFLDEIGEIEPSIQVKLLRVLQERRFQRLGETQDREYRGKIIAATNRNLADDMREGRFREDLYYRLCADIVTTPSLSEQLSDAPDDLSSLVRFVVARVVGEDDSEQADLTREVIDWIEQKLGRDYAWPGNFRELEQCVRNVMIRQRYVPATTFQENPATTLAAEMQTAALTSDELLARYYRLVYRQTGSYQAAARQLRVDWRTVKERINSDTLR